MMNYYLKTLTGQSVFRVNQEAWITAMTTEVTRDICVIAPTGTGKSLLFQITGLVCGYLSFVVVPLKANIQQQVEFLTVNGQNAIGCIEGTNFQTQLEMMDDVALRQLRFVFLTPESIINEGTKRYICNTFLSLPQCHTQHGTSSINAFASALSFIPASLIFPDSSNMP